MFINHTEVYSRGQNINRIRKTDNTAQASKDMIRLGNMTVIVSLLPSVSAARFFCFLRYSENTASQLRQRGPVGHMTNST